MHRPQVRPIVLLARWRTIVTFACRSSQWPAPSWVWRVLTRLTVVVRVLQHSPHRVDHMPLCITDRRNLKVFRMGKSVRQLQTKLDCWEPHLYSPQSMTDSQMMSAILIRTSSCCCHFMDVPQRVSAAPGKRVIPRAGKCHQLASLSGRVRDSRCNVALLHGRKIK